MANLTLKNIPDDLYEKLKESANVHHRSINSELIVCLEKFFLPKQWTPDEHLAKARNLRRRIKTENISAEEISAAKNSGRR